MCIRDRFRTLNKTISLAPSIPFTHAICQITSHHFCPDDLEAFSHRGSLAFFMTERIRHWMLAFCSNPLCITIVCFTGYIYGRRFLYHKTQGWVDCVLMFTFSWTISFVSLNQSTSRFSISSRIWGIWCQILDNCCNIYWFLTLSTSIDHMQLLLSVYCFFSISQMGSCFTLNQL